MTEEETYEEVPDESPPRWRGFAIGALKALAFVAIAAIILQVAGWLRAPSLPEQAPEFVLEDLDGTQVSLASFRGQPVVLNFWATWCGPCRVEAPAFSRFAANHPDIQVLGIAADGSPGRLRKAREQLGITYTVLRGTNKTLSTYGVSTFPTTVLVGPEGRVVTAHTGMLLDPQLELLALGL